MDKVIFWEASAVKTRLYALLAVTFLAANADAAIELDISAGGTHLYWYTSSDSLSLSNGFQLSAGATKLYSGKVETNTTNLQDNSDPNAAGSLVMTASNILHQSGTNALSIKAFVINNIGPAGQNDGAVHVEVASFFSGATLATFSHPTANSYDVETFTSKTGTQQGTLDVTALVNTLSQTASQALNSNTAGDVTNPTAKLSGGGYNMQQQLLISGLGLTKTTNSISSVGGTTLVTAPAGSGGDVPEPATMAMWAFGMGAAGLVRLYRKKK